MDCSFLRSSLASSLSSCSSAPSDASLADNLQLANPHSHPPHPRPADLLSPGTFFALKSPHLGSLEGLGHHRPLFQTPLGPRPTQLTPSSDGARALFPLPLHPAAQTQTQTQSQRSLPQPPNTVILPQSGAAQTSLYTIQFPNTPVHSSTHVTLSLVNAALSSRPLDWSITAPLKTPFAISSTSGSICPDTATPLILAFTPLTPGIIQHPFMINVGHHCVSLILTGLAESSFSPLVSPPCSTPTSKPANVRLEMYFGQVEVGSTKILDLKIANSLSQPNNRPSPPSHSSYYPPPSTSIKHSPKSKTATLHLLQKSSAFSFQIPHSPSPNHQPNLTNLPIHHASFIKIPIAFTPSAIGESKAVVCVTHSHLNPQDRENTGETTETRVEWVVIKGTGV